MWSGSQKELTKLQGKLNGIRAAAKALGDSTVREVTQVKKASNLNSALIERCGRCLTTISGHAER
jgi:hypothetical protein